MRRKWTILVIFIALSLIGFTTRDQLASTFFQWYLKGYCRACLNSKLTYEGVRQEGDYWIFDHPVLTTKKRLDEGGFRVQANQASLGVSLSWLKPTLNFSVSVENPRIDVGKGAEELKKIFESPSQGLYLFEVHTKFKIPQGIIFFHDFAENDLVPAPLFFHMDFACKESLQGCVSLWAGKTKLENEGLFITFLESESKNPEINFNIQEVNCLSMQQILRGIWPQCKLLEIIDGKIKGKFTLTLTNNGPNFANGQIQVNHLIVRHEGMDLEATIPEIILQFTPKAVGNEEQKFVHGKGNLSISPSKILLRKKGQPFWILENLEGSAAFLQNDYINLSLNGFMENHGRKRNFFLSTLGRFSCEGQTSYALEMRLKGDEPENDTSFQFLSRKLSDLWGFAEVEFLGFGIEELELLKHFVVFSYPEWQNLEIHQGTIDAAMLVYMKEFQISEVNVERIAAHQLSFSYDSWNLNASVEDALGSLSFDLAAEDAIKTLNADLKINKGKWNIVGLENASWQLSNINTNLTIRNGVFQKSLLKGTVAGLKGEIELDGTSDGPFAHFNFKGMTKDFAKALPESIRMGLDKQFSEDKLHIIADASRTNKGLNFEGKVGIKTKDVFSEEIFFGFEINRSSKEIQKILSPWPTSAAYYAQVGSEMLFSMVSSIAIPVYSAYKHLQDFSFPGFTIKDGWFHAVKLPLNKYVSPFLFRNDQMQLSGIGDFLGHFDEHKIVVEYNAKNIVLKNSDFVIEIKDLREGAKAGNPFTAVCEYDLEKMITRNSFPIRNATYFEKNSGLLFTEINTQLRMKNNVAHFDDLKTFCNGLYFAGSATVDWSMPGEGVFEVDLRAQEMHGKISQLQHLLSHLNNSLIFLKIPIEGNVGLHKLGGSIHFSFFKDGYDLESIIQGNVTDGMFNEKNVDLSLQEFSLNFDYNHSKKILNFTDIHGTLLVGEPGRVEEYAVGGAGLKFTDFSIDESEFDFCVSDKTHEILRIAGKTHSEINENDETIINFFFEKSLTHFGFVYPDQIELAFKNWAQLEKFQLNFHFQLKNILSDLQRFSRTGLFFISRGILKELNHVNQADGELYTNFFYDNVHASLNFHISGMDIAVGKKQFGQFLLLGSKKGDLWSVEQLQLDNMSLAFDVIKEGFLWNINFLGARLGSHFLIGMEGQYSEQDSHLEAKINLLEADISHFDEWPIINHIIQEKQIAGKIRASGILHAEFDKSMPLGIRTNLILNGSLNQAAFKGLQFDDIHNITFHYDSLQGLSLNNIKIGAKFNNQVIRGGIFLEKADYNPRNAELLVDGLHFDIPVENIPWTVKQFKEIFPEKTSENVIDVIKGLKNQGALQGDLNFSSAKDYASLRIHLNDGIYQFMGSHHDLRSFVIDYDPYALKIYAEYKYNNHCLRLNAHCLSPKFDEGEIILSDIKSQFSSFNPLKINWKIHPQAGYYIQKMSGDLAGMTFDFVRDSQKILSQDTINLVGKLNINFHKAVNILNEQIAARIVNLDLGEGYSLVGELTILKDKSKSLSDSLLFKGEFNGRDFELYGYRFYNLTSILTYTPEAAYIHGMTISDTCGNIQIGLLNFFHKGNGFWQLFVPEVNLNEFRPSLLKPIKAAPHNIAKTLIIRNLNIKNLNGIMGDINSFTGNGHLTFANPPRKNLQHSILAIPAELLTRIGLDLAVLTPVRGMVYFDIKGGKAMINQFKDVYSKGRLSKFYIANNGAKSYVDFDGNLNLQIRMKQYNLIFKLAELFTFNVQGTLRKPSYALQKQ
jgi:hypothetical protein